MMSDVENEELKEMMLELDKRNQEVMNDILNKQKEMIQRLETERPKGPMARSHGFSKEDVRLLWIDEDFKHQHMKKKIDSLARFQHSMKQEFDNKKLPVPLFFNLDELYKNHTRIGELQARERERIMIRLGFWPPNPPAASSSTIHPEAGKRGSDTVLNQHHADIPASPSSGDKIYMGVGRSKSAIRALKNGS